jgi:hypothetical protein
MTTLCLVATRERHDPRSKALAGSEKKKSPSEWGFSFKANLFLAASTQSRL